MALKLITAPQAEPVTLDAAKQHLAVAHTGDDLMISTLITAARQALDGPDGILGRALMPQVWQLVLDRFPPDVVSIPLSPTLSVTQVTYIDVDGVQQTVSDNDYLWENDSEPARMWPVAQWPTTKDRPGAVRITFSAGYADAESVPAPLRAAMLLHISDMYVNRERSSDRQMYESPAYDSLVFPYRTRLIG